MCWAFDAKDRRTGRAVRRDILETLRTHGTPDSDYAAAAVVISELLANAARHTPGPVCVELDWRREYAELAVHDCGPGFAFHPALPPEATSETGRGLYLIAQLTREFSVHFLPGAGTRVDVTLPIARKPGGAPFRIGCTHGCPVNAEGVAHCRWPREGIAQSQRQAAS